MKLKAKIVEEVKIPDKTIIVEFEGDEKKQHFEVKCLFSPFYKEMKKSDLWILNIKMESEIFTDPNTDKKSYFTHLCKKAELSHTNYKKD
ncbi:hypothetical protein IX39_12205 [Chryseobacterium formosense]|uniref:Uncharacterized protein n=1 Tax=Chryseobacterium formosense TaxID=236814 RepID=A0A085ZA71_9FLAO|nr:hypothetical protein [Chryseobacterium formosense]KFF01335.1 hypothetical protein IX39_12205 [Chryseobacterium formosense]SFT45798.1 hypothetical protein SAMN05421857_1130 [Chryseobacterium formosense]